MRATSPGRVSIAHVSETGNRTRRAAGLRLGLLLALLLAGFGLERLGLLDWRSGVVWAQAYAGTWWLGPALAASMAGLYALGLPGSLFIWVAGFVLPPAVAVPVVVAGGTLGALGAHALAGALGSREVGRGSFDRVVRLLRQRSDLATLVAVRIAPGFPHSAINFAAGLLGIPRRRFLLATAAGLAVKGWLYVTAIHGAASLATAGEAVSWRTLAPLVAGAFLLLLASAARRRVLASSAGESAG